MDFWAQHKDFILKILAGFGVFMVALIARGIVHGDDLENAEASNSRLARSLRNKKVVSTQLVGRTRKAAGTLQEHVQSLASEIGFDASDEKALQRKLLERILTRIVEVRELDDDPIEAARRIQEAISINLNGAFGALRLRLRDEMADEMAERSVATPADGLGFQNLVSIETGDLTKYLLQLELVSRVVTDAVGMQVRGVDGKSGTVKFQSIDEVRIDTEVTTPDPIPGANRQYLREYLVRFRLRGSESAILELVNRLENETPRVPIRFLKAERRARDMIDFEIHLLAVAINPNVVFAAQEEQDS